MTTQNILWNAEEPTEVIIANDFAIQGLASSVARVGFQSSMFDNSTLKFKAIRIFLTIKVNASATANRTIYVYALHGDGTLRTDGAAATDGGLTQFNAGIIASLRTGAIIPTDDLIHGSFILTNPGREWGILLYHDTSQNLDSTSTNHKFSYVGMFPQIQEAV